MRCARAQRLMPAAADGELVSREQDALERHVAVCATCAREMQATTSLLAVLGTLPGDAEVPARLEQETLRRVRLAADEVAAPAAWRRWFVPPMPVLALAVVVVVALSVGLLRRAGNLPVAGRGSAQVASAPAAARPAPKVVAQASRPAPTPIEPAPAEPPPALAAAPDLFMDLPILRHMEKLQHFDAIRTTTLDDGPAGTGVRQGENG